MTLSRVLQLVIRIYQSNKLLLPFGACRFVPCCSEYAHEALGTRGAVQGVWMTMQRLLRCHPFANGGVDQV